MCFYVISDVVRGVNKKGDVTMRKRMILGFIAAAVLLPGVSFAASDIMDEWKTFQQHQREQQRDFFKQLQEDREKFLKSHPDIAAKLDEAKKAANERAHKMMEEARAKMKDRKANQPPVLKPTMHAADKLPATDKKWDITIPPPARYAPNMTGPLYLKTARAYARGELPRR